MRTLALRHATLMLTATSASACSVLPFGLFASGEESLGSAEGGGYMGVFVQILCYRCPHQQISSGSAMRCSGLAHSSFSRRRQREGGGKVQFDSGYRLFLFAPSQALQVTDCIS